MCNDWLQIGPITIHGYGTMISLGMLTTIIIGCLMAKKKNISIETVIDITILTLICGFIGSKILACIVNFKEFLKNPGMLISSEGFVIYGAIIGALIGNAIYFTRRKINVVKLMDFALPPILIGHGIGRFGCFFAGCCYGKPYDGIGAITYTNSTFAPNNISIYPTQIMSAVFLIITGIILTVFYYKKERPIGLTSGLYFIIYSVGRFTIEFFRDDPRGSVGILSTSQFISIFIFIVGIIFLVISNKKTTHET